MIKTFRNRYFLILDLLVLPLVVYLYFVLRLESAEIGQFAPAGLLLGALSFTVIPLLFFLSGVYTRYWPFASGDDLFAQAIALIVGVGLVCFLGWIIMILAAIPVPPRSFPIVYGLLALLATSGPRALLRIYTSRRSRSAHSAASIHVLIMGAGEAGAMIAQELQRNPHLGLQPIGFLDDDPAKRGMRIRGLPVLGDRADIERLARDYTVRQVIIALPTAPGKTIREITRLCEQAGVAARIMPGLFDLLGGKVNVSQLRKVEIEDLLRREPIKTDAAAVKPLLFGKRVLITGGGGSIGSELCRQVLQCQPAQLIILGHGENSVFEIENELKRYLIRRPSLHTPPTEIIGVVADVRMPERLQAVFARYRPQIVFHAAAHKHVPLMEMHPSEAIMNNVVGTRNLLAACQRRNVEHFVMISTDKAVNPTSIMGASKRLAELLVLQASRGAGLQDTRGAGLQDTRGAGLQDTRGAGLQDTRGAGLQDTHGADLQATRTPISNLQSPIPPLPPAYVAVRFGNVLGSRGSVVLTFRRQIAEGGPVTVTHPDMRRFFMTIPEAVQLVLQAAVIGQGGEIFTLDMGEPVKLVDLAQDMIRLSGLEVGHDIEIAYTGIRPGEKLFEELFLADENYKHTANDKIYIAANASSFVPDNLNELVAELEAAASRDDEVAMRVLFHRLIAEYAPLPPDPNTPAPTPPSLSLNPDTPPPTPSPSQHPTNPPQPALTPSLGAAGSD